MMATVQVQAEFLGGLDIIFGGIKHTELTLPSNSTLANLLKKITDRLLVNEKDYDVFIEEETVRPGILCLINDTDWELEGELEYVLEDGDLITFTSTLHGG